MLICYLLNGKDLLLNLLKTIAFMTAYVAASRVKLFYLITIAIVKIYLINLVKYYIVKSYRCSISSLVITIICTLDLLQL